MRKHSFLHSLLSLFLFGRAPDQVAEEQLKLFLLRRAIWDMQKLEVGRFRPTDRLIEDLHLNDVLWSDWTFDLGEASMKAFGSNAFRNSIQEELNSVYDLVALLVRLGEHS